MAYCRWINRNCDVYAYADIWDTWTTHVAGRRKVREPETDILTIYLSKDLGRKEVEAKKADYEEEYSSIP